ncbi:OmpA family protein [Nitrosomonas supralitoralis]|uniref:OmpA family protein n=1 Tax=Nitrosomonas supralitoralis TaxID=2116706 RepID=A0A2P7NY78_9PROT|nr:OmpA family protein [Nitrosomonas supralitoralis]PSJ18425.1 OmpA family protein [Nitrosomonas supralitoralis]
MLRFIIIGLSVVFFSLSAVVAFKALDIPAHDAVYRGDWPEIISPTPESAPSLIPTPGPVSSMDDLHYSSEAALNGNNVSVENAENATTQDKNQSTAIVEPTATKELTAAAEEITEVIPTSDTIVKPRTLTIFDGKTFRSGQDIIHDVSYATIEDLIKEIIASPNSRILIEGHTDNIPTGKISSDNMDLSRRRARAIANILALHGVPATRMSIIGYGDRRPIDTNDTAEGRAKNRRVEVKLMPQEGAN